LNLNTLNDTQDALSKLRSDREKVSEKKESLRMVEMEMMEEVKATPMRMVNAAPQMMRSMAMEADSYAP